MGIYSVCPLSCYAPLWGRCVSQSEKEAHSRLYMPKGPSLSLGTESPLGIYSFCPFFLFPLCFALWARQSETATRSSSPLGPSGVIYRASRFLVTPEGRKAARRTARAHLCPPEGAKAALWAYIVGVSSSPLGSVAPSGPL